MGVLTASARIGRITNNITAGGPKVNNTKMKRWAAPRFAAQKGIVLAPSANAALKPESRDALLTAIAKARSWIDDIRLGHVASFLEIAERERTGERQIRLLAALAFVSPRIIAAIDGGTAPAGLTVSRLAKALPYSWAEQERNFGLVQCDPANVPAMSL